MRAGIALAVALLAAGGAAPATAAGPDDVIVTVPGPGGSPGTDGTIANAQLRWGLNAEAGGGAFAGGCNFLSAGRAGDAGGSRVWTQNDGLYRAEDGRVRIEKPTASGGWTAATWDSKCRDASGAPVTVASASSTSGNQVVIDGGTGQRRDGTTEIGWSGSFTVVFYGGMTYWSVTDPKLTLDGVGNGRLVGTASGYGTSMDDLTSWNPVAPREVVLAEIRSADAAADRGFTVTPEYRGVAVEGAGQVARSAANAAFWGSFPQSFVDFHRLTGQQGYWLTSGGIRDAAKPATAITVSFDAATPVVPPAPEGTGAATATAVPSNPLRAAPAAVDPTVPARAFFAANAPLTTQPQGSALVPAARGGIPAVVGPLLGSAAALGVGIVAVLSMMRALPWQRRRPGADVAETAVA
ncbi:hypothetical protein D8Y23_06185 [Microbacterium enclense]|uniref:Htaa protein n=1 Tax=Microbacterium enclense TaxID=993073 RepID=A0A3S4M136_9MICO|nr:hypothetical protein D8Y23_06185 [Microbacterium enclense]